MEGFKRALSGHLCRCTGYASILRGGEALIARFSDGDCRLPIPLGFMNLKQMSSGRLAQIRRLVDQVQQQFFRPVVEAGRNKISSKLQMGLMQLDFGQLGAGE